MKNINTSNNAKTNNSFEQFNANAEYLEYQKAMKSLQETQDKFAHDMERMFNLYKASGANKQFEGDDREEDRLLHLMRILYKHKYPRAYVRVIVGAIENHDTTPLIYVCYRNLSDETPHIISANDRITVKNK